MSTSSRIKRHVRRNVHESRLARQRRMLDAAYQRWLSAIMSMPHTTSAAMWFAARNELTDIMQRMLDDIAGPRSVFITIDSPGGPVPDLATMTGLERDAYEQISLALLGRL